MMANGQDITRTVGFAIIHVGDAITIDEVIFGEPGDLQILGARSLEGMNLRVDSRAKKLPPAGRFWRHREAKAAGNKGGNADNKSYPANYRIVVLCGCQTTSTPPGAIAPRQSSSTLPFTYKVFHRFRSNPLVRP